jgi:hypothetical protein
MKGKSALKAKKKLELNKQTIANLTKSELEEIKAGAQTPCWENLWTMYKCAYMYTGSPETETEAWDDILTMLSIGC